MPRWVPFASGDPGPQPWVMRPPYGFVGFRAGNWAAFGPSRYFTRLPLDCDRQGPVLHLHNLSAVSPWLLPHCVCACVIEEPVEGVNSGAANSMDTVVREGDNAVLDINGSYKTFVTIKPGRLIPSQDQGIFFS